MRYVLLGLLITSLSCGYKRVAWHGERYHTIRIEPVVTATPVRSLGHRMHDALIERCLAGSGLKPLDNQPVDLILKSKLNGFRQDIIATESDGRTKRIQFTMQVGFELWNANAERLWALNDYQYSDQFQISTTNSEYRDEAVYIQDQAMDAVAELVVANLTLVIQELEASEAGSSP